MQWQPMTSRQQIAAMLLDRDEGGDHLPWAEQLIKNHAASDHDGDCTKKSHACNRCIVDRAIADADRILARIVNILTRT